MKKKKIVIISILVAILVFVFAGTWAWVDGKIFVTVIGAKIINQGSVSETARLYKSNRGDYLLFLDNHGGGTYWIGKNAGVGVPTDPIPGRYTSSFRTPLFVFCWDFEIALAGGDFFASGAQVSRTDHQVNFVIDDDDVSLVLPN